MENSKLNFIYEVNYESINYDPNIVRELLKQNKVLVLRNYTLDQDINEWFDDFSEKLGTIIDMDEDLETGSPTGNRWIAISYDENNPDKYRTAPVRQPLHTDYSYIQFDNNIQFFYCNSRAERGGATTFIDVEDIVELLKLDGKGDLLERLMTIPIRHQKAERFKEKPIIQIIDGEYHINWNYYPALTGNSDIKLIEDFHEFLETRIVNSGLVHQALLEKNDCVFFHDELLLHGRNSYFAKYKGQRELMKGTVLL
jgi:alpha-ketoglutarate-dependent taurine dioxygenase